MISTMSSPPVSVASYLRVASIAIAAYDFLNTLHISFEIYIHRRKSLSGLLYVLLRVISICVLTVSSVGYFHYSFTASTCRHFYVLAPALKVLQQMLSHFILGLRTFNLSRRSWRIAILLAVLFTSCVTLEALTSLHQRAPSFDPELFPSNCVPATGSTRFLNSAWINYVVCIIFDMVVTIISVYYLLKYKFSTKTSMMSNLTRMMLFDGIGYFIALTACNVSNLLFYKLNTVSELQTAAASTGYAITWIMTQKLLIHLYKASVEHRSADLGVTVTQNVESPHDVSQMLRSQFESKSAGTRFALTEPDFEIATEHLERAQQHSVHVRVEKTVRLESGSIPRHKLEDYSRASTSGRM